MWIRGCCCLAATVSMLACPAVRAQEPTTPEQLHPDYSPIIKTIDAVAKRTDSTAMKVVFLLDAADWSDARTQQLREFVQTYVDANTTKLRGCDAVGLYLYRDKLLTGSEYEQPVMELIKSRDGILKVKNQPELPPYGGHTDPFRALADVYSKERDCVYVLLSRMASADKIDQAMSLASFEKQFGNKIRHEPNVARSILVSAEKGRKTWAYFDVYRSAEYKSDLPCQSSAAPQPKGTSPSGEPTFEWLLLLLLPVGGVTVLALKAMNFRVALDGVAARGTSVTAMRPTKLYVNLKDNKFVDESSNGVVALVLKKNFLREEFIVSVEPGTAKCTGNENPIVLTERRVITIEHNGSRQRITFSRS